MEIALVELNDENRSDMLKLALSMYLGEKCQGCGESFDTLESLDGAVWWPWDGGRIGHKACFDKSENASDQGRESLESDCSEIPDVGKD